MASGTCPWCRDPRGSIDRDVDLYEMHSRALAAALGWVLGRGWLPLSLSPDVGEPRLSSRSSGCARGCVHRSRSCSQRVRATRAARLGAGSDARLVSPRLIRARARARLAIPGGPRRQRVVEAAHCDELVDAAALMIAVAIDPIFVTIAADVRDARRRRRAARARTPPMMPISPRATPIDSPPEPIAPKNEPRLRVGLRASAGAWFGAMPRPAATIAVDLVIPATRLGWAELGALAIPRQRTEVSDTAGADLWLATAVLRGCIASILRAGTKGLARLRPMACGGLAIGAMGGTGRGDIATNTARELWVSPVVGGGLDVAIARRFGVFARFDGHIHARLPASTSTTSHRASVAPGR